MVICLGSSSAQGFSINVVPLLQQLIAGEARVKALQRIKVSWVIPGGMSYVLGVQQKRELLVIDIFLLIKGWAHCPE